MYDSLNFNIVQRRFLCRGTHGQADFAYAYLQMGTDIQRSDALSLACLYCAELSQVKAEQRGKAHRRLRSEQEHVVGNNVCHELADQEKSSTILSILFLSLASLVPH